VLMMRLPWKRMKVWKLEDCRREGLAIVFGMSSQVRLGQHLRKKARGSH